MKSITEMISHGYYFKDLEVLQTAIEKKGRLPKNYFRREENYCEETWGGEWRSKQELKDIREELISEIIEIINSQNRLPYKEKMGADHYARYFHALTILKANKYMVHKTNNDLIRNAFIELWQIDDGSEKMWKTIDSVSWSISEAIKGLKGLRVSETVYPED